MTLICLLMLFAGSLRMTNAMWWNLAFDKTLYENTIRQVDNFDGLEFCKRLEGSLSVGQMKLCQLYTDHMASIGRGARMAISECQTQFQNHQWNCSLVSNQTVYGNVFKNIASREAAFVYAISAAGALQSISRSCRYGDLSSCGCSKSSRPSTLNRDWLWGGCGDNVEYGYKFVKQFIDLTEKSTDLLQSNAGNKLQLRRMRARRLVNLHNYDAGRRAVYKYVKVECKCHGVSGSCSMKTCWLKMAPFHEIGNLIKEKYDNAVEVRMQPKTNQLRVRHSRSTRPSNEDLVYLDESPDYCLANPKLDILGTRGRQCNKTSSGPDSCRVMCCGRGHTMKKVIKEEKCKCKFQWCCSVKCETCITEIETYVCK